MLFVFSEGDATAMSGAVAAPEAVAALGKFSTLDALAVKNVDALAVVPDTVIAAFVAAAASIAALFWALR